MQWIKRKFNFNFPVSDYTGIIDRLRNTPSRIEQLTAHIPLSDLTVQLDGKWSVQEHVGHLLDLEALFTGRLDDFESDTKVLRPADMTNQKTYDADHNAREFSTIITNFKQVRGVLIQRLEAYPPEMFGKTAQHPRLDKPMRVVDSLYFQAEHDDHHVETIIRILR